MNLDILWTEHISSVAVCRHSMDRTWMIGVWPPSDSHESATEFCIICQIFSKFLVTSTVYKSALFKLYSLLVDEKVVFMMILTISACYTNHQRHVEDNSCAMIQRHKMSQSLHMAPFLHLIDRDNSGIEHIGMEQWPKPATGRSAIPPPLIFP